MKWDMGLDAGDVAMDVSDVVIRRFAHLFIQLHREEATAKARRMVEEMLRDGDRDGADNWRRVFIAMRELGGAINVAPDDSNDRALHATSPPSSPLPGKSISAL
jgi:hypothetical protein